MSLGRTDLLRKRKRSRRKRWSVKGYLSAKQSEGRVVVCIFQGDGSKKYYVANLDEAKDVIAGAMAFTKLRGPKQ